MNRQPIIINNCLVYEFGAAIDSDGSYRSYGPNNTGLDYTENAKDGDKWVGVVTNSMGDPIIQGPNDPAPGLYISQTALTDPAIINT